MGNCFLLSCPSFLSTVLDILGILVVVVGGVFAAFYFFNNSLSDKRAEVKKLDDDLVSGLTKKVEVLQSQVKELQNNDMARERKMIEISAENKTLTKVLQGKDKMTIEFQRQGFQAIKQAADILSIVKTTNQLMQEVARGQSELTAVIKSQIQTKVTTTVESTS